MRKRFLKLMAKRGSKMFKRFGFVKKTIPKTTVVHSAEIIGSGGAKSLAIAEGSALKLGEKGLVKVGRSEAAAYNRAYKGRRGMMAARRAAVGRVSDAVVVSETKSASKFWDKARPFLVKGAGVTASAAGWFAVDHLLSYAFDKDTHEGEKDAQVAAEDAARDAISEITKIGALEDALTSSNRSGYRNDGRPDADYYTGSELSNQADLVKRLMFDLSLSATGDISSASDISTIRTMGNYERADLLLRLATISKAIANESNSPEFYTLMTRQAASSSLDSIGWTESFERLVKLDDIDSTGVEAIAAEYNELYEGLFEEHRVDVADRYFNEVTQLFNFKRDRTGDFTSGEQSSEGQLAKLRLTIASLVTDDSFADVEGFWDKLKVDKDNPKDDEFLAAQEMIRFSTLGSDYISIFVAAVNNDSYKRRSILSRG